MDFKELSKSRYSMRNFLPKEVENECLIEIVKAVNNAPSAVNYQPIKLFVLKNDVSLLQKIAGCYHREWIKSAPVIIVVVGLHNSAWKRSSDNKDFTDIDAAIAIDHLTLQATDLGLGTCWVCNFNTSLCKEILQLQTNEEPIAMVPIGYAATDEIPEKKRKTIEEISVWM